MANRYTDDQGLFQGGKYGRRFGRVRDWVDDNLAVQSNLDERAVNRLGDRMGFEGDMPQNIDYSNLSGGQKTIPGPPDPYAVSANTVKRFLPFGIGNLLPDLPENRPDRVVPTVNRTDTQFDVNQDYAMARDYALDFDPTNPEEVRILQKRLNLVEGLSDQPLAVDGKLGPKTQAALDKLQASMRYNPGGEAKGRSFGFGDEHVSSPFGLVNRGPGNQETAVARGSLVNRPSIPNPWNYTPIGMGMGALSAGADAASNLWDEYGDDITNAASTAFRFTPMGAAYNALNPFMR